MPVAIQAAERQKRPVSPYLMPLAFGSLIGGTITQIGTSPNILISGVREQVTGQPYGMFDYTAIGLPLSLVAVAFLSVGWRLLPSGTARQPPAEKRFTMEDYTTEARLPAEFALVGRTVEELETRYRPCAGGHRHHPRADPSVCAARPLGAVCRRHPGAAG